MKKVQSIINNREDTTFNELCLFICVMLAAELVVYRKHIKPIKMIHKKCRPFKKLIQVYTTRKFAVLSGIHLFALSMPAVLSPVHGIY
ncbi:hypothetical protein [Halobacillus litoralis]|uniref:hypothetical protein n=1 Tax=Halobacillus litoralis TaxID=45668 RepID=UPI001CFED930|nr:hypothetical protein [Halobacillus litoralis]